LARSFSICGGTKWIMRSSLTGSSRSGAGAPMASGLKKLRGSFIPSSSQGAAMAARQLRYERAKASPSRFCKQPATGLTTARAGAGWGLAGELDIAQLDQRTAIG